jgi:Mat/Ecp fimbriae outer membrane usher protein
MFGSVAFGASGARGVSIESTGIPSGFDELTRDREQLVDVFFGGRKVGEARVVVSPGHLKFEQPDQVLTLVPNVETSSELSQAFEAEFPTNAGRVCPDDFTKDCGVLSPQVAGLIFDEDHFRVDLFVNRKWLRLVRPEEQTYLPNPTAGLSLTSSTGLAVSGSTDSSTSYNFQNRTVVAFHNARIRAESAYASHVGFLMDTVVGEIDRPGIRYSAGLFWAPGLDLTGERRIVGVGFGTQFDTRTDRDALHGTPLILFLSQPARVDILIDGRLVTSGAYEAGNNMLDTSTLPDGSYSLVLRIHEQNGNEREERRFFAKNAQIAPVGQPIFFGYAGMLANTRPGTPVSVSSDMFYQLGAARRLNEKVAVDLSLIGTSKRPIVEAGGWVILPVGRVRAAALVSAQGDRGALLQVASAETGPFSVNFDLRRIWSHDNSPLIPISTFVGTFDSVSPNQNQLGDGSYTQASGSIGYQLGDAFMSIIGSLRKDEGLPVDYSVGPNLSWTIVNRSGMQIALHADAQLTRTTTAGYVGVRMLFNRGAYSVSSDAGARSLSGKGNSGNSSARSVGDTTAHFSYANDNGTDLSLAAGATRELESTTAHAEGMLYSRFGSVHGELLRNFEGSKQTQYGLSLQTGAILNRQDAAFGGRNLAESALVVSIDGAGDAEFDVLINGQAHGRIKPGQRLPIFLQPYHSYSVRLRPIDAPSVWYDTAAHEFILYPGNVQNVRWHVEHLLTVFGQAVRGNGEPVADAMITSRRGMGQSNREGYFQIETSANDALSFESGNGTLCTVKLVGLKEQSDFERLGKVVCQ